MFYNHFASTPGLFLAVYISLIATLIASEAYVMQMYSSEVIGNNIKSSSRDSDQNSYSILFCSRDRTLKYSSYLDSFSEKNLKIGLV